MAKKLFVHRIAESSVETYLRKEIEAAGGICKKYIQGEGFPDRIIIIETFGCLVETKAPMGQLSELQKAEHAKLRAKGILVFVLWTKNQVDKFMAEYIWQHRFRDL